MYIPGRAPYLLFASLIGGASAILLYRFAVMPPGWEPPTVFTAAPPALAAGSWLVRQTMTKGAPWPWPLVVAMSFASLCVVMLIAYLTVPSPARSALVARSLPGMTVSLPSGKEEIAELEYEAGSLLLSNVASTGGVIALRWNVGPMDDEDEQAFQLDVIQKSVNGVSGRAEKWPGPGKTSTTAYLADTAGGTAVNVTLACGARRVVFSTLGIDAMQELLRRVLRSFVCQPDLAKDQALSGLPWILSPPQGWEAQDEAGSLFSDGQNMVRLERMGRPPPLDVLRRVMELSLARDGGQAEVVELEGEQLSFKATDKSGLKRVGWSRYVTCPRGKVLVTALVAAEPSPDAALAAIDRMVKDGRCLRDGEPAPRWPVPARSQ